MSRCDVSFQRCLDIDCDINRLCVCWVHSSWLCSHEISSSDDFSFETFAQLAASTLTELPVSSPVWQILVYQILYVSFWYVFSDNKEGDYISLHLEGSQKLLESQTLDIGAEVWTKPLRNEHSGSDPLRSLRRGFVHTSAPMSRLCDSILFCIRQHQASGTVISFWYVFSDYKGGDDISWLVTVRVTSSSVNERITPVIHIDDISSHPSPSSSLWCVFSDYQRMSTQSLCPCCSSFFATCRYGKARIRKCSKTLCLLLRKAQRRGTLPKRLQDTGCLVDIGLAQTVVSETQHFLDHCWLVSFKVCTLKGFHSAVVQELTPADCESLNRNWDSCGAPIHRQRLLWQGINGMC